MSSSDADVVLPMWRGTRGVINTAFVGVLGVAAAAAFWIFAVAVVVRPACTAYARAHGLTYVDYTVFWQQIRSSSACEFQSSRGTSESVKLVNATSFLADTWVGIAFSPMITAPAFIVLFAFAWTSVRGGWKPRSP